jgi:NAD(P)-dependent dehydrogenase (short-subunit alcohol dehydrogenase family)
VFTNKAVIVTGASSGIGRQAAVRFAREHAGLVLVGRDDRALSAVRAEVAEVGAAARVVSVDVTASDAPAAIVAAALEAYGRVDVLVNAAGIIAQGTVDTTSDDAWDGMFDVNVRAVFRLMRAAAPHLGAGGAIVNVSSVTGLRAFPGVLAYAVSKAAVDQLTRCAALELAPRRIRVNAVNPGVVVTNLHRRAGMDDGQYAAFLDRSRETHPLGRAGEAEEIAELVVFLASERTSWITGETIAIDGGRHLTCAR